LRPTPVSDAAGRLDLPLLEPEGVRSGEGAQAIGDLAPDALVVVAYGELLPTAILDVPKLGSLNLHFSLLPRWRGAAPVQRAILEGDTTTGVSVMLLDEGLDTGPIVLQREVPIAPADDTGSLGERLAGLGAPLVVEALRSLRDGTADVMPQDAAAALVAPKMLPEERDLDWTVDAQAAVRRIRALAPAPGALTSFREAPLKVLRAEATGPWGAVFTSIRGPGQLHMAQDGTPVVDTRGGTAVRLLEVVPMGKARMAGSDWARGARFEPGERLG
jgi:methionyl-tRNA formyltransferase